MPAASRPMAAKRAKTGGENGAWAGGWKPERDWDEPADDDAMLEAVEEALANDDIDGLVDVDVSIADEPGVDCNIAA